MNRRRRESDPSRRAAASLLRSSAPCGRAASPSALQMDLDTSVHLRPRSLPQRGARESVENSRRGGRERQPAMARAARRGRLAERRAIRQLSQVRTLGLAHGTRVVQPLVRRGGGSSWAATGIGDLLDQHAELVDFAGQPRSIGAGRGPDATRPSTTASRRVRIRRPGGRGRWCRVTGARSGCRGVRFSCAQPHGIDLKGSGRFTPSARRWQKHDPTDKPATGIAAQARARLRPAQCR